MESERPLKGEGGVSHKEAKLLSVVMQSALEVVALKVERKRGLGRRRRRRRRRRRHF